MVDAPRVHRRGTAVTPFTLPNLLTLGRLLSVPLIVWLISDGRMLAAFWLFVAAAVTDALDGALARLANARSVLGDYLDPLADKALLVSIYITLGLQGHLDSWLVIMVVFRDVIIIGGALLLFVIADTVAVRPLFVSKVNTLMQLVLAVAVLAHLGLGYDLGALTGALTYMVAATTAASGLGYLMAWLQQVSALGAAGKGEGKR